MGWEQRERLRKKRPSRPVRFIAGSVAALLCLLLSLPAVAQKTSSAQTQKPASAEDKQLAELNAAIQSGGGEPGARLHALEAYLRKYPDTPALDQIYSLLIDDATALNDDARVLEYREKLQQLKPEDLALRIKTLNLLLLNTDQASIDLSRRYADELLVLAKQKAQEKKPDQLSTARWDADMRRLQSLAYLLRGSAYYNSGNYAVAEQSLNSSLGLAQTQEAAIHLARTYEAENKLAQAVDTYALALALPGGTIAEHNSLRQTAGALYRKLHNGSEAGFGDLILAKFDQVAARDRRDRQSLAPSTGAVGATSIGDFVMHSLDGAQHRLSEYKGKVVVVDFWATWCEPCLAEHPLLEKLRQKYSTSKRVAFVEINEDDDEETVAPFLKDHKWPNNTWIDTGLGEHLGIDSLPTTLVLTPHGAIDFRLAGVDETTFENQLDQAIQRALQTS